MVSAYPNRCRLSRGLYPRGKKGVDKQLYYCYNTVENRITRIIQLENERETT